MPVIPQDFTRQYIRNLFEINHEIYKENIGNTPLKIISDEALGIQSHFCTVITKKLKMISDLNSTEILEKFLKNSRMIFSNTAIP